MGRDYSFILPNEERSVIINMDFEQLQRIPPNVRNILFDANSYNLHSEVQMANFVEFIYYLINVSQTPSITVENSIDFLNMCNEFNVDSSWIADGENKNILNLSIITKAASSENHNISDCEKYIAQNLDYFIDHYPNEMYNIKIQRLYNIFNHVERNLLNEENAYQFIKSKMQDGESDSPNNIFILLKTLNIRKLSRESAQELLSNSELFFGFTPRIDFGYLASLNQNITDIANEMNELKTKIDSIQIMHKDHITEYNFMKECFNKHIESYEYLNTLCSNVLNQCNITRKDVFERIVASVSLPMFLKSVPSSLFKYCNYLQTIEIPTSVTSIEDHAFSCCPLLKKVVIPYSVCSIGNYAFYGC